MISLAERVAAAVWSRHPHLAVIGSDLMSYVLAEQGGDLNAWLASLADSLGHPVGLQVPVDDLLFQAPRSWTHERTRGWLGGQHQALRDEYGLTSLAGVYLRGAW